MPSNRPLSPSKPRAHRSASSSSLIAPVVTTAHVRRLSRIPSSNIPASLSSHYLPRFGSSSAFPMTPDCEPDAFPPQALRAPSLSDHPLSLPRLGAAVDALIRPPAKGKPPRPHDPPALFILFGIFLSIFIFLIFILRSFFPSATANVRALNARRVEENLERISKNLPPRQFWPLPDSAQRAAKPMPSPLFANVSVDRIWQSRFLSARHVHPPLRLSVVAACKDRTAFIQTALPDWLRVLHPHHDEVLLVDWASKTPDFVPLSEVVRASDDPRLSVVSLTHSSTWVLSRAYNLAFSLARGEWLLKLDCDTAMHHNFLAAHPLPKPEDHSFYRFDWATARDRNEQHLNGIFLARTSDIRAIHGYDERITTYGWEDSDLYNRLQKGKTGIVPALKALAINIDTVHHMPHDDSLREAGHHLYSGPVLETQINSQAADDVQSWTDIGETQRTCFQLHMFSRDARFLGATVVHSPSALLDQVSPTRREAIESEALNRVLHDLYGLPWSSLPEIDQPRAHVLQSLTRFGGGPLATAGGVDSLIFVIVQGTIAERVVGIASALAFSALHRRTLFLTWGDGCSSTQDEGALACKATEFFDLDYVEHEPDHVATVRPVARALPIPIFQIARWKCRGTVAECVAVDPAFGMMEEWQAVRKPLVDGTTAEDLQVDAAKLTNVLKGKIEGKRNIVLRVHGELPLLSSHQIHNAIRSLRLSTVIRDYMSQIGDVSEHVGIYIGQSLRPKAIEAVALRVLNSDGNKDVNPTKKVYFVTGPSRETVDEARKLLPPSQALMSALGTARVTGKSSETAENIRQVAELFLLAKCKEVINDGRPSHAALTVISTLRKQQ